MNRRILASIMMIGLLSAGAGLTTTALFNDSETSASNLFKTGAIDLKIDWNESYNGEHVETQEFTDNPGPIFNFKDLKPGDHGEATVSLHLEDNPGWVFMRAKVTEDREVKITEPERSMGDTDPDGELNDELIFTIWKDDGDNKLEDGEKVIKKGPLREIQSDLRKGKLLGKFGDQTRYVGIKWKLPLEVGNRVQKDKVKIDFEFYAEQVRHNPNPDNPWTDEPANNGSDDDNDSGDHDKGSENFYQVDLVGGEPLENLSETTYHSEGRMQRYMHGGPGHPIATQDEPDQVKTGTGSVDCVDSEPFTVNKKKDYAKVEFTVLNKTPQCATGTKLSLVSYTKPYPGWKEDRAGEQEILDSKTHRFDPGHHSLIVSIPDVNDRKNKKSCKKPVNESKEFTADEISQAKYGYDFKDLSKETKCEVRELFLNQPFSEGLGPGDVMTRDEISQERFDMPFDDLSDESMNEVEEAYEQQFSTVPESGTYTATQGAKTVEIEPLEGNMTVEELYDFRLPDRFDNQANRDALNGATYPGNGPYYGSVGTQSLQQADTSIMFLYDGPNGLSFVVVHEGQGSTDGGSTTWEITNLTGGNWVVKDDLYLKSNGQKAGSNYDDWQVNTEPQVINWTWGSGGSDGGAYRPLGENFSFTIDPAFNEESPIYKEFYNGDVEDWQVLSGDINNPERTSLNLTEEVTVTAH